MGATASKQNGQPSGQEKMAQLDRTTVNRIEAQRPASSEEKKAADSGSTASATLNSPLTLPRQQFLDSSIQAKIREELGRLRKQEAEVQKQIESALEKENLDRASQGGKGKPASTDEGTGAKGKSSILLRQELEDVRSKIERHQQRRSKVDKAPGVQQARSKLLECYNKHTGQTLECWAEVKEFKESVARAEQEFVASLAK